MLDDLPSHSTTLLAAKTASGKTFDEIASAIDKPEVWTTALFFGQTRCNEETARAIAKVLNVGDESVVMGLCGKGSGSIGVEGMTVRGGTWDGPPKVSH